MASDPDFSTIIGVVAKRTGYPEDTVELILQESWGMIRARWEWDVSSAKEEGLRLGARVGFLSKQEAAFPEEDGFLD